MNNKEYTHRARRHGELLLKPIAEIPATAVEVFTGKDYVLAHSETGHHHIAVGNVTVLRDGESMFLRVNKESLLKHNKSFDFHAPVTLPVGDYGIRLKNAYDPFTKVMRRVQD